MRAPARRRTTSIHGIARFWPCQILVLVRRLWASLVVDELPGGNHRRERAGAYVATFRSGKVQPSSPSACRAAASRSYPFGVARGVETDPHLVVRHLLPLLANIEGQPAIATAIHGIGRQARANPCGDPLALITGGGGFGSRRRWNSSIASTTLASFDAPHTKSARLAFPYRAHFFRVVASAGSPEALYMSSVGDRSAIITLRDV